MRLSFTAVIWNLALGILLMGLNSAGDISCNFSRGVNRRRIGPRRRSKIHLERRKSAAAERENTKKVGSLSGTLH